MAQRRGRLYAVIYEGRDPATGKEVRRWHPAGTDRAEAERLATRLAKKETSRVDAVRSLTFGAYLTSQWLPGKKLHLATSTYRGYERNIALHVLPTLGRARSPPPTFNEAAGLPGGELEITLLHFAMEGLLFDQLTTHLAPALDRQRLIRVMVERLARPGPGAIPGSR